MPMSPEIAEIYKSAMQTNEAIVAGLNSLNDVPSSIPVPAEARKAAVATPGADLGESPITSTLARRIMTRDRVLEVRESLKHKDLRELNMLFAKQAARRDTGIPLYEWLYSGGQAVQDSFGGGSGMPGLHTQVDPDVAKAIDTNGVSALIRQDLEPIVNEVFNKLFPLWDEIPHEPANGLVHAWNNQTSFGDADIIGELDTVTDDKNTYERKTTNVAIFATRRGVSLKSQFAVLAGGMNYNPERLELTGGLRAIARSFQRQMLQGNDSDGSGLSSNEKGAYNVNGFDGFRKQLNTASAVNVDPATNPTTTGSLRRAFDSAILPISDAGGGDGRLVFWGDTREQMTYDEQQDDKLRILQAVNGGETTIGVRATAVQTVLGRLPFYGIPGQAVGAYTAATYSSNTVRDIYVLDMDRITVPYLGSEGVTVLEIPIGVGGQLTHLFILFMMGGLAAKVLSFSNKLRVKTA